MNTLVFIPYAARAEIKDKSVVKAEVRNQIPDGQTLILRPKVGRFVYDEDIYTLKQDGEIYLSLDDIIHVLEFAIDFDQESLKGRGWFAREDWRIIIDLKNGLVESVDEIYEIEESHRYVKDGIAFVHIEDVQKWFQLELNINLADQFIEIDSAYPLVALARKERRNKRKSSPVNFNKAELPRLENEKKLFDINTATIRSSFRYRKDKSTGASSRSAVVGTAEGKALYHDAYSLVSADDQEGVRSVQARLSQRSENSDLLGPLKARSYAIGDTSLVNAPLLGRAGQELGVRFTNNDTDQLGFQVTTIEGDAVPGWDVELYRNNILLGASMIDEDGRYLFQDVQLFIGQNNFEVLFYGPQGEVRVKRETIPVTREAIASQNNIYDVSLSFSDTQTYRKNETRDDDYATPHLAARVNKVIGDSLVYSAMRYRSVEEEGKLLLGAGLSRIVAGNVIDTNVGIDGKGQALSQVSVRREILGWNSVLSMQSGTEDYKPNGKDVSPLLTVNGTTQKSFRPTPLTKLNLSTSGEYRLSHNDETQVNSQLGLGYQKGHVNISNNLRYNTSEFQDQDTLKTLDNNLSMRAILGEFYVRGGIDYDFLPEQKVDRYFTQVSYRPRSNYSADFTLNHRPDQDFTDGRLNVNHTNKYFRTSPFIEYNSDQNLYAGVNVNMSLVDTPSTLFPEVTSQNVSGKGLVSAFVYHDQNGNKRFDGDDLALEGVVLESVNTRRRVVTNDDGYAVIKNLPISRATDVKIDEDSLPDSFMISGFEGVSIYPRAGDMVALEFPVYLSGEIDGTVKVTDKNGELQIAERATLNLYPVGQKKTDVMKIRAASDGFYVASKVPPGQYLMMVDNSSADKIGAAAPLPKIINIGYEGQTIYGLDVTLDKRRLNVPLSVSYSNDVTEATYVLKTSTSKRSKLLTLLGQLDQRDTKGLYIGMTPVAFENKDVGATYYVSSDPTIQGAHQKCQSLNESAVPCTLEVVLPMAGVGAQAALSGV